MLQKMKNLVVEEEGQALTEYGLIIGLIVVGVIVFLGTVGDELVEIFTDLATKIAAR
jgi:pilus assembly protein Flp/PilA